MLGLLSPVAAKNSWTIAETAGAATPDGMQRLLNAASWDTDGVRDDCAAVLRHETATEPGTSRLPVDTFTAPSARPVTPVATTTRPVSPAASAVKRVR